MADRFSGVTVVDRSRLLGMPGWVLLPQIFLAAGWLRAAVAHAGSSRWWDGTELRLFVEDHGTSALPVYDLFLSEIVQATPSSFAAAIVVAELATAAMLAANRAPMVGLAVGAFLNVHFILAGVVNPSVFYLVIALVIAAWRVEQGISAPSARQVARVLTAIALGLGAFLAPFIESIDPEDVIEDPAAVLIFIISLVAAISWVISERLASTRSLAPPSSVGRPTSAEPAHEAAATGSDQRDRPLSNPRPAGAARYSPTRVMLEVEHKTGYKFNAKHHARAARKLGVRPLDGDPDATLDAEFAEYVPEIERYLYSQDWIDLLSFGLSTPEGFRDLTGTDPTPNEMNPSIMADANIPAPTATGSTP